MQQLQQGITLQNGKYTIERVLGQGGFGITYLAEQTMLNRKVAIKEFFLKELCIRKDGTSVSVSVETQADMVERYKIKFTKEAQILARFNSPNIVHVLDIFNENDTWYYVMDYVEGRSLDAIIKERGHLEEDESLNYLHKIANALSYIHGFKVNHLDIKPSNIMVRSSDNEPILIDFGISKQYDEKKNETSTTPPGISDGYSPLEQYKAGGVSTFSPQADIYALGATLYKMLTGITPPSASDVLNDGLPKIDTIAPYIQTAIKQAMQPKVGDRPRSVESFVALLDVRSEKTLFARVSERNLNEEAEEYYKKNQIKVLNEYGYFKMKKERQKSMIWICCISSFIICIILFFTITGIDISQMNILGWILFLCFAPLAFLPGLYISPAIVGIRDKSLMNKTEQQIHKEFVDKYIKENK